MTQVQGIFPAVLTPFRQNGALDLDAFAQHVSYLYDAGVDGIFAGGNAGEWYSLTLDEREALASAAVQLSRGRGKALVHVGATMIEDSLRLARHAESIGADAIGCLPPYLSRLSAPEIARFYARISSASDLPFFIYYFPTLTGGVSGSALFTAVRHLPNLAGYKFTDMNLIELEGLVEDGLCVLNGHDPNLSAALMLGASGGIGSYFNLVPREAVEIYRASLAGDWRRARVAQRQMNRVIASGRKHRLIPALKFLCSLNGPSVGAVREPLLALTADEQRDLEKELEWLLCSH